MYSLAAESQGSLLNMMELGDGKSVKMTSPADVFKPVIIGLQFPNLPFVLPGSWWNYDVCRDYDNILWEIEMKSIECKYYNCSPHILYW